MGPALGVATIGGATGIGCVFGFAGNPRLSQPPMYRMTQAENAMFSNQRPARWRDAGLPIADHPAFATLTDEKVLGV